MLLIPNNRRPTSKTINTGAQLWRNRHPVAITRVAAVNHFGESREVAQLRGIAKAMLHQWEADPNKPCCLGDRLRSALIAGSRIPSVFNTMKDETLENNHIPITIQRYLV